MAASDGTPVTERATDVLGNALSLKKFSASVVDADRLAIGAPVNTTGYAADVTKRATAGRGLVSPSLSGGLLPPTGVRHDVTELTHSPQLVGYGNKEFNE